MAFALQSFFKTLLALVLLLTPVLPDIASAVGTHPAHVQHHADHGDHASAAANPTAPGQAQTVDHGSCDHHASCSGNCCATCAQCGMSTLAITVTGLPIRSVQTAANQHLHHTVIVSTPSRPPQAG